MGLRRPLQGVAGALRKCSPKKMAELTHVRSKGVMHELSHEARTKPGEAIRQAIALAKLGIFPRHGREKMAQKERDVLASCRNLRHAKAKIEASQKVTSKGAFRSVGRGNKTKLRTALLAFTEPLILARVEDAKDVSLSVGREVRELVEKKAPSVRGADETFPFGNAWIRVPLGIPEKLGVDQGGGQRSRIARDQRSGPRGERVHSGRDELLAGSSRPENQDVPGAACSKGDVRAKLPARRRLSDDAVPVGLAEIVPGARDRTTEPRWTHCAKESQSAANLDDVPWAHLVPVGGGSVHEQLPPTEICYLEHFGGKRSDQKLRARQPLTTERRQELVLLGSLPKRR